MKPDPFKTGEQLSAEKLNELRTIAMRHVGGDCSFVSKDFQVTRKCETGSTGSIEGATAIATLTIPAAAINGAAKTSTPGKLLIVDGGVTLMDWKKTGGVYDQPPEEMEALQEGDPEEDAVRDAVNYSMTTIRASVTEPVLLAGTLHVVDGKELFVVSSIMDLRGLPGYSKGSAPGGADDPDLQIPYHAGGDPGFELDSVDCSA